MRETSSALSVSVLAKCTTQSTHDRHLFEGGFLTHATDFQHQTCWKDSSPHVFLLAQN